jgi:hypothetical protein
MQWYLINDERFCFSSQKGQCAYKSSDPTGGPEPLYANPCGSSGSERGGYGSSASSGDSTNCS